MNDTMIEPLEGRRMLAANFGSFGPSVNDFLCGFDYSRPSIVSVDEAVVWWSEFIDDFAEAAADDLDAGFAVFGVSGFNSSTLAQAYRDIEASDFVSSYRTFWNASGVTPVIFDGNGAGFGLFGRETSTGNFSEPRRVGDGQTTVSRYDGGSLVSRRGPAGDTDVASTANAATAAVGSFAGGASFSDVEIVSSDTGGRTSPAQRVFGGGYA